ncbi:hypothetical protein F0L68_38915 [Solihabitans fulvus]|uniref:Uncharacterized protein n=1 Tax=Solihabitans fulvus TaxID=1892852 RepID=A0A5B2WHA2_9PSEU|nr:hypothetical protein [Solihabitans fulvus]KAA2250120.1 hypothetical protein F0L68_38915 [Solihabitans fulvus]
MQNTMTQTQAAQRVEEHARRALAVLPRQARPELLIAETTQCDDPTDNGPLGRVIASVEYQVHDLPPAGFGEDFDALRTWWEANDFRVLADERPANPYLWVEHTGDGFRLALKANDLGELYLTGSSPCVWPDGTPAPTE